MALGEEHSSKLFKHLQEEEIEKIVREVAVLGTIPPDVGAKVLDEFHQMTSAADYIATGGVEHARRLLTKTLGPDLSRRILDRVVKSFHTNAGFATLEKANPQQLSKFILAEHPQTIALILAHLNAWQRGAAVTQLPTTCAPMS
jgi:flagellar motor switch protein FliG